MALPRDIDPKIEEIDGITYYNIDDICREEINTMHEMQTAQINTILQKYIDDFYTWHSNRMKHLGVG